MCEAEDMGEVVSLDEAVSVPAGDFEHCIETHDWTPLEPGIGEHKFYCPDVGVVLEEDQTNGERAELVEFTIAE